MSSKLDVEVMTEDELKIAHDTVHSQDIANGEHASHDSFAELLLCVKEGIENAVPMMISFIENILELRSVLLAFIALF